MFNWRTLIKPSADFKQLLSQGAIIVDVRTAAEFAEGHIPGAFNNPLDQLTRDIPELLRQKKR